MRFFTTVSTALAHIDDKCDICDGNSTEHERIGSRHHPERSTLIGLASIPGVTDNRVEERQRWYKSREGRDDRKYEEPLNRPVRVDECNRCHRRDGHDVTDFPRSPCHKECWNLHNIYCLAQFEWRKHCDEMNCFDLSGSLQKFVAKESNPALKRRKNPNSQIELVELRAKHLDGWQPLRRC